MLEQTLWPLIECKIHVHATAACPSEQHVAELAFCNQDETDRASPAFQLLQSLWPELLTNFLRSLILVSRVKKSNGWLLLKSHFFIVVDAAPAGAFLAELNACCLQLSLLLQAG